MLFYEVKGCAMRKQKKVTLKVDDLKEASEIVYAALIELNQLHKHIKSGNITGKEVEEFMHPPVDQANDLKILCEAANIGSVQLAPTFTELSSALEICKGKLEVIKEYKLKLFVVVEYCKRVSEGM